MILATSSVLSFFCRASASQAASSASSSYSMGLRRNTLSSARALAPRFMSASQAASACGVLPAHSDICALRSSHSTLCGSAMSAASLTSSAAFKSPAAAKVSQASCSCSALKVLASSTGSAVMAITLRNAVPASCGSPAPKASCARYHQVGSPGGRGCDSFRAACHALRESPVASKACTPFFRSCKRGSAAVVLRRAAKNKSLASNMRPALSASVAPRASSCALAAGKLNSRANSASCMVCICWVSVGWLAPNIDASTLAVLMDANSCVPLLMLCDASFKRVSSSVAAWWMSASFPPSMAWPSCTCHNARSQRFQLFKPSLVPRARGSASFNAWRASFSSPPPSSFSTSSRRKLKSLGSVRMMLRK